jgi:hypothetical protein
VYWPELERCLISERHRAEQKLGRKPKLTPPQIVHSRKLVDQGEDRQKVATLLKRAAV